ncbi:MAG: hypothetical protein MSH60_03470 [Ruminococcus sp.]|nr:hypothetical protein [Ruminococcus sp.]
MLAVNTSSLVLMIKFALIMLGLLLLVFVIAVLTPKLAKLVDKIAGKEDKPSLSPEEAAVRSIYDGDIPEENTDNSEDNSD